MNIKSSKYVDVDNDFAVPIFNRLLEWIESNFNETIYNDENESKDLCDYNKIVT